MAMINAPTFDHKKKARVIFIKNINRLERHFSQRRLARDILGTVCLVAHVGFTKQTEQLGCRVAVHCIKGRLIVHIDACWVDRLPFLHKIAAVSAITLNRAVGIAAVGLWLIGQELATTTA